MTAPLRRNGKLVSAIERGCENKLRYSDEFGARAAGLLDQQKYGEKMYLYPCDLCRGWHLTKRPQKKDRYHVSFKYPAARHGI